MDIVPLVAMPLLPPIPNSHDGTPAAYHSANNNDYVPPLLSHYH